MTQRTRLLRATLLFSCLSVSACGDGSTGTNPGQSPGESAPLGSGAIGTGVGGTGATGVEGTGATSPGAAAMGGKGDTGESGEKDGAAAAAGGGGATSASGGAPSGGASDTGTGGSPAPDPDALTVQLGEVRQIIRGFGINATIVPGGETLPWDQLFTLDGADALGLSILRIGMNQTGVHRGVPDDWETARTLGARVIGTCWSAPPQWKTNSMAGAGGHLLPEHYEDWATLIADYANEHGLYAMSIGNQTDFASCDFSAGTCVPPLTDEFDSMVYTGKEMADFVRVAGPIFDDVAPDTKMIAPEASSWTHLWSNLSPTAEAQGYYESSDPLDCDCYSNAITAVAEATCADHCTRGGADDLAEGGYDYGHWLASDSDAWNAVDILGVHEYESQIGYAWPADVTGGVRDKEVWQTEVAGEMHWPEQGPSTGIENGVAVARWIHSALTVGEASAWLYWWYEAHYQDDNEGLGLLLGGSALAKRYYTMGNFSRYIRPDVFHAVRVAGPSPENVMVSGYKGDSGEVVIVAINETDADIDVPIAISGGTAPAAMVPHVTSATENWAEGAPVPVTNGSLPAALPAMSVTTFVSQ